MKYFYFLFAFVFFLGGCVTNNPYTIVDQDTVELKDVTEFWNFNGNTKSAVSPDRDMYELYIASDIAPNESKRSPNIYGEQDFNWEEERNFLTDSLLVESWLSNTFYNNTRVGGNWISMMPFGYIDPNQVSFGIRFKTYSRRHDFLIFPDNETKLKYNQWYGEWYYGNRNQQVLISKKKEMGITTHHGYRTQLFQIGRTSKWLTVYADSMDGEYFYPTVVLSGQIKLNYDLYEYPSGLEARFDKFNELFISVNNESGQVVVTLNDQTEIIEIIPIDEWATCVAGGDQNYTATFSETDDGIWGEVDWFFGTSGIKSLEELTQIKKQYYVQ